MTKYKMTPKDWNKIFEATKKMIYEFDDLLVLSQHYLGDDDSNRGVNKIGEASLLVIQAQCIFEKQALRENPDLDYRQFEFFFGPEDFTPDDDYGETDSQPVKASGGNNDD